jgi:glycosyltransferase involved in cell wall biosynthesis
VTIAVGFDVTHAQLNRTGLGRYPSELVGALRQRKNVQLITASAAGGSRAAPARIARGLLREGLYYPAGLARAVARGGAQLLHTPTPAPVRGGGLPLVVTVHDLLPLRHPHLFTLQTRAHTRLYAPFVRRAQRVITPSSYTREQVIELLCVAPERVIAIAEGCDARFAAHEADRELLRAEVGVKGPYVLIVGTLEPRKNLTTALRVFERVAGAVDAVELVIVGGSGWRNREFESELERAGVARKVRLPGFVPDELLAELYAGAACFLYPSLGEGFGLPPLEAMAAGAPVVISEAPALLEVTGEAALSAGALDVEALAAHVVAVLEDPELAARLRAAGIERARSFTWDAAAAATERVYADVVRG